MNLEQKNVRDAFRALTEWQVADPHFRRYVIAYRGGLRFTPHTWSGGWAVLLKSKRCPDRQEWWYVGQTLSEASERAVKAWTNPPKHAARYRRRTKK